LKISHSYFCNLDGGIVYWRSLEESGILWRTVVRRKFLLPSVLVVSEIKRLNLLQLLWNFYWSFTTHNMFFWTVRFDIRALVYFQKIREQWQLFWWRDCWTLPYSISICWYFGPLLVTISRLRRVVLICSMVGFCKTHCTFVLVLLEYLSSRGFFTILVLLEYLQSSGFFFISIERFFPP